MSKYFELIIKQLLNSAFIGYEESIIATYCMVWCVVSGVWCLVSGVWCLVSGVWCLVSGVWCLVSGVCGVVWCGVVWCGVLINTILTAKNEVEINPTGTPAVQSLSL